ncbi:hypothetical protein [Sporosarcina sp. 6E9]|uniref:hypothetical protein n=1 Tax=Sporosarcina sp. 6E9 TaxID=2819235 RepID=UPI001B3089D0|nr:hypothetical protein [Sporosarcina sp. 6E9]
MIRWKSKHSSVGLTTIAPLRIVPEYINIDLEKKLVTGLVKYDGKEYLSVIVDVRNNKVKITGSLRRIAELTKTLIVNYLFQIWVCFRYNNTCQINFGNPVCRIYERAKRYVKALP